MKEIFILIGAWGVWNLGDVALKHHWFAWWTRSTGNNKFIKEQENAWKKQGLTDGQIKKEWYANNSSARNLGVDHIIIPLSIATLLAIFNPF